MARMINLFVFVALIAISSARCAHTTLYEWGKYDQRLYQYYKNPDGIDDVKEEIYQVIQKSEQSGERVAPGLYAEYGFFLLESGESSQAVRFFEKERESWPESAQFMNQMIEACNATTDEFSQSGSSTGAHSEGHADVQ